MKVTYFLFLPLVVAMSCNKNQSESHDHDAPSQQVAADTVKKSIKSEAHGQVGKAHLTITYHAPAVRGRMIWGGLVPNNEVWVTGAHRATALDISSAIEINGVVLPEGKYALFTIPGQNEWTVIVNKKWDQHLADEYNQNEDVVRLTVKPQALENLRERLLYSINSESDKTGTISFAWEKIKIVVPFIVVD